MHSGCFIRSLSLMALNVPSSVHIYIGCITFGMNQFSHAYSTLSFTKRFSVSFNDICGPDNKDNKHKPTQATWTQHTNKNNENIAADDMDCAIWCGGGA